MTETNQTADATRPDEMVEKTLTFQIVENGSAIHMMAKVSFAYSPMMSAETCTEMETLIYDLASKARRIILAAPRE